MNLGIGSFLGESVFFVVKESANGIELEIGEGILFLSFLVFRSFDVSAEDGGGSKEIDSVNLARVASWRTVICGRGRCIENAVVGYCGLFFVANKIGRDMDFITSMGSLGRHHSPRE